MLTFTLTKADVIFQFGSPKRTICKVHMNNALSKTSKNMLLGQRNLETKKICNS